MAKRRKRKKQQAHDDDLTPKEWNTLMKWYTEEIGMTKARAAAFLSGLIEFCDQAKERHDA
jgi:hypothetical protein